MTDPRSSATPVASLTESSPDNVVTMHDVTWDQYEVILQVIGESSAPRTAYLEGELTLMSPGRAHEFLSMLLARLIFEFAAARDIPVEAFGSETFRKKTEDAGLEPDQCFSVGHAPTIPDFAIEVVVTSGSIDKLEIYARLGFKEVWFWERGKITVFGLERGRRYRKRRASRFLSGFPFPEVERILATTEPGHSAPAVKAFRRWLERR